MSSKKLNQVSKFLSFVLRHKPEAIGLQLDANGWATIDSLIEMANNDSNNPKLSYDLITEVVKTSDKKRFAISKDGLSIRANQGHTINIDLELEPTTPPLILYHGTATRFLDSIFQEGLQTRERQHVHLSADIDSAIKVGQRHGKPVVLKIDTLSMLEQGYFFYLSENNVWLTTVVPAEFISVQNP